jgi:DNA-binding XRE family transcriptional regulator
LPIGTKAELDRLLPHPAADVPLPEVLAKGERAREDFQVIFGNNLRASRLKCGLKQSEVAERTGLTQQYLSLIEAGQQNITLKTMILLAEVVDNDVADMLRKAADLPPKA